MSTDSELTGASQPTAPPFQPSAPFAPPRIRDVEAALPVRCPYCQCPQFFGSKKLSTLSWVFIGAGFLNIVVSIPLMFVFIGFLTIILTPVFTIVGFYGFRKLVNTCARCKRNF